MHTTPLSVSKAIMMYIIVSLFLFFEMAVQVSPSVMATELMRDLNLGAFGLGLMSGFYFYTYTAMQIPSGILFDKFNPRLIITLSILTCSVGVLLFSLTHNIFYGSIARLLMGAGSAFAFVSVLVITADLFETKYFAAMTGITQMLAALGAMSGALPVSMLITEVGWRTALQILAAIGFILAILVWKLLHYERTAIPELSTEKQRIADSLKQILKNKQTWFIAIYAGLLWAPMSGFASLWGVPFLVHQKYLSQTSAAFLCSLMWLGLAIASPVIGILSTRFNTRVIPLWLSAALGAIAFALLLFFNFSAIGLAALLILAGAACSGQALSFALIIENNNPSHRATAIALNNMAVVISGAIFQPLIGTIIEFSQKVYSANNYLIACTIILIAYVIATIMGIFFIKEKSI